MKDKIIEKLIEIIMHVGAFGSTELTIDSVIKELKSAHCKDCGKLSSEITNLKSQDKEVTDNQKEQLIKEFVIQWGQEGMYDKVLEKAVINLISLTKDQDKEVKDEDNSDPMCFHECPMCQTRCNCDTVYCTHCEEEEIKTNK